MTDIRQLKAFVAVAEELNFHKAAERLATVQPALSRLIQNLELDMQVQLLRRTTRHVELTEAGKTLPQDARALLQNLEQAVKVTQQTANGTAGKLILGYIVLLFTRCCQICWLLLSNTILISAFRSPICQQCSSAWLSLRATLILAL